MADLTLKNARWLAPDGRFQDGTLVIREGVLRLSEPPHERAPVLDAAGMRVVPGAIDSHTHLREPGQEQKEGIERGTRAALAGGVTTVLDMPNNAPPIDSEERLAAKRKLFAQRSRVNYGLHVQAPYQGAGRGYASAKIYLARSSALPALGPGSLQEVFRAHRCVTVHAEDESGFLPASGFPGQPRSHHLQRPRAAVTSALAAVENALGSIPFKERPRLVLCHVSTAEELAWLEHVKSMGWDVWGETCPHYWRLTEDDYVRVGPQLKVNPPLRTQADVDALLSALAVGPIDFISTDHAPHLPQEKADEASAPSGIPGLEWYLPLVLELVESGRIGWSRFLELTSRNAARCFGLAGRGLIKEGMRADLALVSRRPGAPKPALITGAGYDPYPDAAFSWCVERTIVNGRIEGQAGEEVVT
ncbi:MAG: dihydroorotase family protein [Deltaproteobacteria bacterium]|nr:dihydroorotase family protein [Deltaproteobacteria bacterium]